MKKSIIGLGLFSLFFLTAKTFAFTSPCCCYGTNRCNVYTNNFILGADGIYWTTTLPSAEFEGAEDCLASTDYGYNAGWRVNVGYIFACSCNEIWLTYTDYNAEVDLPVTDLASFFVDTGNITLGPVQLTSLTTATYSTNVDGVGAVTVPTLTFFAGPAITLVPDSTLDSLLEDLVIQNVSVTDTLRHRAFEVNFSHPFVCCRDLTFRLFAGVRYARFERELEKVLTASATDTTDFLDSAPPPLGFNNPPFSSETDSFEATVNSYNITAITTFNVNEIISRKASFQGIGPQLGFELNYHFGSCFQAFGMASGALIIGDAEDSITNAITSSLNVTTSGSVEVIIEDIDTSATDGGNFVSIQSFGLNSINTSVSQNLENQHNCRSRLVPNVDVKAGLNYTYTLCNDTSSKVIIEFGYELNNYFNAIPKLADISITEDCPDCVMHNISFYGPYLGVTLII